MADFFEVATAKGHLVVNMDAVEKIVPHIKGAKIYFRSALTDTIISTETPSDILQGLETYNETKAVAIWKRTYGKET